MMELVKTKLEQERQQHNVDEEPYVHNSICYNVQDILFKFEFKIFQFESAYSKFYLRSGSVRQQQRYLRKRSTLIEMSSGS